MSWIAAGVALVGTAASMSAADKQAKAAKEAGGLSAAASAEQVRQQKLMYDQTRRDQAPWRDVGQSSLNQLAMLMGLPQSQGGTMGGRQITTADLVDRSGDVWQPNADLYATSPEYKKAWDDFIASHRAQYFGAMPSDLNNAVFSGLQGFDIDAYNARQREASGQQMETSSQDPRFGSLARSFGVADFEEDPGYAFRQSEGQKAIERSAAARGGLLSGSALKGIERFGQDLASQEYGNAFNRFQSNQQNQFNRFASLAGVGQTANNALQQAGSQFANAMTGISQANAANQGNALLAQGNARASGYQGIGNALAGAFANWPQQQSGGYQVPAGYSLGSGSLGNTAAMNQGYQPLDYGTYNSMGGFYD